MAKKLIILVPILLPLVASAWFNPFAPMFGDAGTITRLDQWAATSSPSTSITQRVMGTALRLTGLSAGCLSTDANGIVTSSGSACGSGSGGANSKWATSSADSSAIHTNGATKVGIGTTSPYAPLSVVGQVVASHFNATSTTATSTFASGLKIGNPYGIQFEGYSAIPQLFATDPTTGVHFDGPGILSFHNGGEQTMLLSSTQKVGVASSSPSSLLGVHALANRNIIKSLFAVASSTNSATTTIFNILNSGYVGIGTDAPSYPLDVTTANTNSALTALNIHNPSNGVSAGEAILFSQNNTARAKIASIYDAGVALNSLYFYLGGETSQGVVFRGNGNVGIATTAPYAKLSVAGQTVAAYFTATTTTASTFPSASTTALTVGGVASTSQLRIDSIADGCLNITGGLVGGTGSACGAGGGMNSKWATSTDTTSIFTNGATKVGIGTDTPYAALSVVGASGVVADRIRATSSTALNYFAGDAVFGVTSLAADLDYQFAGVTGMGDTSGNRMDFRYESGAAVFQSLTSANAAQDARFKGLTLSWTAGTSYAAGTEDMYLVGSNLGIGTSSPYAALSVVGPSGVVAAKYHATSSVASIFPYASTTAITVSGVASTSVLRIDTLADGCLNIASGLVGSQACGAGGANSKFATSSGDATAIHTNAAAKVGIGSTTPFANLGVAGSGLFKTAANTARAFVVENSVGSTTVRVGTSDTAGNYFSVSTSSGSTHFNIDGSGKIGIGTSTPYALLSVVGQVVAPYFTATTTTASTFPSASTTALTVSGVASTSVLRIDTLANGCLNIASGLVGSQTCATDTNNSKWATSSAVTTSIHTNGANKVGIGSTTPYAKLSIHAFANETYNESLFFIASSTNAATSTLFEVNANGSIGIGSSTPYGLMSIGSSPFGYGVPLFVIATSTFPTGHIFSVMSTSSTLTTTRENTTDSGARVGIGATSTYNNSGGLLDQLTVNGRIMTPGWSKAECTNTSLIATVSADTANYCGSWTFQEDNIGTLDYDILSEGIGATYMDISGTANNGAGFFLAGTSGGALVPATTTPVFEASVRFRQTNASSTLYVGLDNLNPAGTTFETEPTAGCYFQASSTIANWWAVCRTGAGSANATIMNTGVASITPMVNAQAGFNRMRISMDSTEANFYIQSSTTGMMRHVAKINTTYPSTVALNPGIHLNNGATASLTSSINFFSPIVWWRTPLLDK